MERAVDCEAKLVWRVEQASREVVAKSTMPATPSEREDWNAERIAWSCWIYARCAAGLTESGGHGKEPSTNPMREWLRRSGSTWARQ